MATSQRQEAAQAKRGRRIERFERVRELRRQGAPIRAIARELGMSRNSVRRYLRCQHCPDGSPGRGRRLSRLDAHRDWIDARIAEGRINAKEPRHELVSRDVRCSYATVRRHLNKILGKAGKRRPRVNSSKPKRTPPPPAKQLSFDWNRRPEKRSAEAQARLVTIRSASPELSDALDVIDGFTGLIRKQSTATLKDWLSRAEAHECPEVRCFGKASAAMSPR